MARQSGKRTAAGEERGRKVGAVLVVGGGIAGIQASLDLANSGFRVHLVESSPSIGGTMARLDKTFPTNDCAMCILSPKLVECGRHLNVDLLTQSRVKRVEGEAGHFKVRVARKARYIDTDVCTGCGACLEACPTRLVPDYKPRSRRYALNREHEDVARELIEKHGTSRPALIRVMQLVNARFRHLPRGLVFYLAERFDVPVSTVYRIGTFYTAFSFEPRGRHVISVCTGTACHIKGAGRLVDRLKQELDVDVQGTTPDEQFTLETVRCLGCCSLAPVIKVDDTVYGAVKVSELPAILNEYRA